MPAKISNNAATTLSAGITNADNIVMSVVDGSRFPTIVAGEYTYATLQNAAGLFEHVKITLRSGNSLTIPTGGRAKGNTTALAWNAGDIVELRPIDELWIALQAEANRALAATGANDYVVTPTLTPNALETGVTYRFIPVNDNTTNARLNWAGFGLKAIVKNVNQQIAQGDILAGQVVECVYDGTNFQLLNPANAAWLPGDTKYSATPDAQANWLPFSTTPVSRTTYAALFAKLVRSATGSNSNGFGFITGLSPTTGNLSPGMIVSGPGVPNGTRITTVDSSTQVSLDNVIGQVNAGATFTFHWWGLGDGSTTFNIPRPGRAPMSAGLDSAAELFSNLDISTGVDTANVPTNVDRWNTGDQVTFAVLSGTPLTCVPANALNGGTVWVVRTSNNTIKFATSLANAQNGVVIDITSAAAAGTYSITRFGQATRFVGTSGGAELHAMTNIELLAHNHTTTIQKNNGGSGGDFSTGLAGAGTAYPSTTVGGNNAMPIMNPYQAFNGLIKT